MKKYLLAALLTAMTCICFYYSHAHKSNEFFTEQNDFNLDTPEQVDDVIIQNMMMDMAPSMAAQMGASIANQQIGTQATQLGNILTKQSQTLQANIKGFQSQAQTAQQKNLQAKITEFANESQSVQTKTQAAVAESSLELKYLYQNISLNQPQQQYLASQVVFDQIFSQGTMLTPQGYAWKNPFSVGDWEYEKDDNSFYQYQSSPIFNTSGSSAQSENNSIFTEYTTTATSYSITGKITFYQVAFPFFVGIIFNKARWISGNYESLRKSRMVGMYGKSDSDIGIYFSEQITMTDDQVKSSGVTNPIQTPLQQILSDTSEKIKKAAIPLDTFKNVKIDPVVFNFEITTTPTKVTFAFWNEQNIKKSILVENLQAPLFMYHGIGFICPGAVAQFTLTAPTDLIFSDAAISKHKG